jgi:hypothetical protein
MLPDADVEPVREPSGFAVQRSEMLVARRPIERELPENEAAVTNDLDRPAPHPRLSQSCDHAEVFRSVVGHAALCKGHARAPLDPRLQGVLVGGDEDGFGASWTWVAPGPPVEEQNTMVVLRFRALLSFRFLGIRMLEAFR